MPFQNSNRYRLDTMEQAYEALEERRSIGKPLLQIGAPEEIG
jgi:hypothetical protein